MNTRSADISSTGIMTPKQNCNADQNNNYIKSYVPKKTSHLPPKTHIWKSYYYLADGEFDLVYRNIAVYIVAHIMFLYGWYSLIRHDNWDMDFIKSYVWGILLANLSALGVSTGSHRLWAHKSYKARLPMSIFIMCLQTLAGQNCIYIWARDHRLHHKFSDTDADPHNTRRGFFFAHVGWLLRKKHPELKVRAKEISFDDLLQDPVVKFQMKNYTWLYLLLSVVIPIAPPLLLWHQSWWDTFVATMFIKINVLHATWFVNSTAHMFGDRPYNPKIQPCQNIWVSLGGGFVGEGYHNYHHSYPHDYGISESGSRVNVGKYFIDFCKMIGLAYDLRRVDQNKVEERRKLISHEMSCDDIEPHDSEDDVIYETSDQRLL